jgi:pyruvate dehydrogenase E2 component (dihydrolipoamide acetyltransferase)
MTDVLMPALSPTMEEGTLAKWHVKVGDAVKSGDVIAEIETDKATMEVEAVDEGVIEALLVAEGTEAVKVNAPIARLKVEGEKTSAKSAPAAPPPEPAAQPSVSTPPAKSEAPKSAPLPNKKDSAQPAPMQMRGGERIFASPLARRLAVQLGVDLGAIKGSGPHGRIIRRDVEGLKGPPVASGAGTAFVAEPARQVRSLEQMGIAPGSYDLVPLDGMKKTVARRISTGQTADLIANDKAA